MSIISVREHARLTTARVEPTLNIAHVTSKDFEWLVTYSSQISKKGARLVELEGSQTLTVDNYVGVIELPSGTQLEILPKHSASGDDLEKLRRLTVRLIASSLNLTPRKAELANIQALKFPLTDWLALQFLIELDQLVKRGLRFGYERVEEESRFLRGQLDIAKQLRQPVGRHHLFQIRHDIFTPDRPENRLIRGTLDIVNSRTLDPTVRQLANVLNGHLEGLPASNDIGADFKQWRASRLTARYSSIKPFCELILNGNAPISQAGAWRGVSLLFPMEQLFERHVAKCLQSRLAPNARLRTQAMRHALCTHRDKAWFYLRPDIVIDHGEHNTVLDTKWKVIDSEQGDSRQKYGLSQADFYQLFAYGHRYLSGHGDMLLIYPRSANFFEPLPRFEFSEELRLWAVPFDLDADELVPGDWLEQAPWCLKVGANLAKAS